MTIIQRIHEAAMRFQMQTGHAPTVLYIGVKNKRRLDALLQAHIRFSSPIPPQIYEQTPVFDGMKMLTVLGDPDHLVVA